MVADRVRGSESEITTLQKELKASSRPDAEAKAELNKVLIKRVTNGRRRRENSVRLERRLASSTKDWQLVMLPR